MSIAQPTLRDLLYLLTIPNIGPGRIRRLFSTFQSVEEIQQAPLQRIMTIPGFDRKLATQLRTGGNWKVVEDQLRRIHQHGVRYLSIWDERYPPLLKQIPDAPAVCFTKARYRPGGRWHWRWLVRARLPPMAEPLRSNWYNHSFSMASASSVDLPAALTPLPTPPPCRPGDLLWLCWETASTAFIRRRTSTCSTVLLKTDW